MGRGGRTEMEHVGQELVADEQHSCSLSTTELDTSDRRSVYMSTRWSVGCQSVPARLSNGHSPSPWVVSSSKVELPGPAESLSTIQADEARSERMLQ